MGRRGSSSSRVRVSGCGFQRSKRIETVRAPRGSRRTTSSRSPCGRSSGPGARANAGKRRPSAEDASRAVPLVSGPMTACSSSGRIVVSSWPSSSSSSRQWRQLGHRRSCAADRASARETGPARLLRRRGDFHRVAARHPSQGFDHSVQTREVVRREGQEYGSGIDGRPALLAQPFRDAEGPRRSPALAGRRGRPLRRPSLPPAPPSRGGSPVDRSSSCRAPERTHGSS